MQTNSPVIITSKHTVMFPLIIISISAVIFTQNYFRKNEMTINILRMHFAHMFVSLIAPAWGVGLICSVAIPSGIVIICVVAIIVIKAKSKQSKNTLLFYLLSQDSAVISIFNVCNIFGIVT